MTKEDIEMMKERFKQDDLYQQSTSPFKDFQMEQFYEGETILEGQNSKTMTIDGRDVVVIFNFSNGLIDSKDDQPAIEYPMHWEYWKGGFIEKVVDAGGDTEEYWENGVPVRIERNLSERRK